MRPSRRRRLCGAWALPLVVASAVCARAQVSGQTTPAPANVASCATCHGVDGNSVLPNVPSLAGQPAFFLLNQLILMREGVRRIDVMVPLVRDLTDGEIDAIAKYFAALPAKSRAEAVDAKLAERGAELSAKLRCASCHGPSLAGQDQMPRLAKQRIDYLIESMKALRDDKRSGADTLMTAAIRGVSDADLAALAHFATSR